MAKWTIPLDQVANKQRARIEAVVRKVTFDAFASVGLKSPVDTGRFVANWNVSYGAPDLTTTDSTVKARVGSEVRKALSLPVGGIVYMTNALPYANRLEYGYSKQAPQGMVRLTAAEFAPIVKQALAQV